MRATYAVHQAMMGTKPVAEYQQRTYLPLAHVVLLSKRDSLCIKVQAAAC